MCGMLCWSVRPPPNVIATSSVIIRLYKSIPTIIFIAFDYHYRLSASTCQGVRCPPLWNRVVPFTGYLRLVEYQRVNYHRYIPPPIPIWAVRVGQVSVSLIVAWSCVLSSTNTSDPPPYDPLWLRSDTAISSSCHLKNLFSANVFFINYQVCHIRGAVIVVTDYGERHAPPLAPSAFPFQRTLSAFGLGSRLMSPISPIEPKLLFRLSCRNSHALPPLIFRVQLAFGFILRLPLQRRFQFCRKCFPPALRSA